MRAIRISALHMAAALVAAALPAAAEIRDIEGTATYDERTALPAEAVLEVQLLELPGGEAAAVPISQISIRTIGSTPFPFRLAFDDAMIDRRHTYALASRIRLGEETLFRTAEAVPMFAAAAVAGPPVIRMVRAEPPGEEAAPGLADSTWLVTELPGGELVAAAQAELRFGEENEFWGTGGCNDFQSSYRLDPPKGVSFGKLSVTLRGCSGEVAQQERLVMRAVADTRSYEIDGEGLLVLQNAEEVPVLTLKRRDK